ncbi:MAG: hypothetical protein IT373_22620 [Polyangiaceae bacterium]|nr:hypothetical protein [Polyangiaceae bacterium]
MDLLLVVDNSRGLADKQVGIAAIVPEVLGAFINPRCVDSGGGAAPTQPTTPSEAGLAGYEREVAPVRDLHIGIVTSSLGGLGSDACAGSANSSENDGGRLVARVDTNGTSAPTYQNLGFLAWDPDATLVPPGESDAGVLASNLSSMVSGVGERGCGYESTLEAWYRFLVDPNPYESIQISSQQAVLVGTDAALLAQRSAFSAPILWLSSS